jgi:hypothetical protein
LISERNPSFADLPAKARAYRQVLSLLLAARRPTEYLIEKPAALRERTETYLTLLAQEGIISERVRDEALAIDIAPGADPFVPTEIAFGDRGAARSIRNRLTTIRASGFYETDRLDLTVEHCRRAAPQAISRCRVHQNQRRPGSRADRQASLADGSGADKVVYVHAYERGEGVNRLRVHADTLGSALDANDAVMLDLGSTAKLRTRHLSRGVRDLHAQLSKLLTDDLKV